MQNTNGLRFKFRSRAHQMHLFQGMSYVQNNFLSVFITLSPLSLTLFLPPSLITLSQALKRGGAAQTREKVKCRFSSPQGSHVTILSLVVQLEQPKEIQRRGG